jgi:hypothetical protein
MPKSSVVFTAALFVISSLFTACGKKESPVPTPGKDKPEVVVVVPPPVATKTLLPVKLESSQSIINLTYLKDTGFLREIETSEGVKEIYSYTEKNELKQYDRYKGTNKEYTVYYLRDQNGTVIQGNQNNVDGDGKVLTPAGSYKISYNSDNHISAVSWLDNSKRSVATSERFYSSSGNVVKLLISGTGEQSSSFTFDDKNGIFKDVKFREILSIESLQHLLFATSGNLLSESDEKASANNVVYSYVYGADNYASSMTATDSKGSKKVYKVTYR